MQSDLLQRVSARHVEPLLKRAARMFPPGNVYGVSGYVVERKRRGGRLLPYRTLRVYVDRKEASPSAPIPELRFSVGSQRYVLLPDVVGVGRGATHPVRRARVPYTGVHHSAAIRVGKLRGSVSVVLAGDATGRPTHLVSAGHLFVPGGPEQVLAAENRHGIPFVVGTLAVNLLEDVAPKDGALVRLTSGGEELALETAARARPAGLNGAFPNSLSLALPECSMFRATSGDFSWSVTPQRQLGVIHVSDDARGHVSIRHPIVSVDIGDEGDSGGLLHETSTRPSAVGSYVGALGNQSIFESLTGLLAVFRRRTGLDLRIWESDHP